MRFAFLGLLFEQLPLPLLSQIFFHFVSVEVLREDDVQVLVVVL